MDDGDPVKLDRNYVQTHVARVAAFRRWMVKDDSDKNFEQNNKEMEKNLL